jgi:hypothetical protein
MAESEEVLKERERIRKLSKKKADKKYRETHKEQIRLKRKLWDKKYRLSHKEPIRENKRKYSLEEKRLKKKIRKEIDKYFLLKIKAFFLASQSEDTHKS